jgi:D-glycero-D-manno-heptose 1,7-bisphosphate phosphatase
MHMPAANSSHPAVFFDRDGVVNVSPGDGYVLRAEDFHFAPGTIAALALCKARGFATILVTSQQGVGKGLMTQSGLDDIHARMQDELARHAAAFDGIYACTHLSGTCTCRKPSPEMIFRAQRDHGLDLTRSWLVGDHDRDIQMAINAGVPRTIRILSHHEPKVTAEFTLDDTAELPALLSKCLVLDSSIQPPASSI